MVPKPTLITLSKNVQCCPAFFFDNFAQSLSQSGHYTVTFSAYAQNYSGQGVWLQLSHSGKDVTLMFMLMLLITLLLMLMLILLIILMLMLMLIFCQGSCEQVEVQGV